VLIDSFVGECSSPDEGGSSLIFFGEYSSSDEGGSPFTFIRPVCEL
jgi:hypothetical protein